MARTYASADRVGRDELLDFVRPRHRVTLITTPQGRHARRSRRSPPASTTRAGSWSRPTRRRAKAANLRRDPAVSAVVHSDDWNGPYVQVDGTAEVLDLPDAIEPLVDYYRSISGEHPDWDEYRQAMQDQGKSLIRITVQRWGPVATGGFPPEQEHR